MGIDPVTHKPRSDALGTGGGGGGGGPGAGDGVAGSHHAEAMAAHLRSHTAQWESAIARLEAQERMARAREASRLRAVEASASFSARRRRCPDTPSPPTTSMLSYSESATTHASVHEQFRAARGAMQEAHEEAARKDHHAELQLWGDHCTAREFAAMLLDESLHEQQTENEKEYWIGIMHLVNSPIATSSSQTSVAMPSSSAPLQTSVAPEAYSSVVAAASSSTSVAAPAPAPAADA